MYQLFDQAYGLPQTAQAVFRTAPIDGIVHLKPSRKVTCALLDEHEARRRRHLVGQVRMRLLHDMDLTLHLRPGEVFVVETDADLAAFRGAR